MAEPAATSLIRSQIMPRLEVSSFGQTYLGKEIRDSIERLGHSSAKTHRLTNLGELESVVLNDPDRRDEGLQRISSKIADCQDFFYGVTYKLDAHSEAAFNLFSAVAAKQKLQPDFAAFIAYNTLSSSSVGQIATLMEMTGAKISFGQCRTNLSRNSLHQKLFILDRERAAIGGDNIDNPKEADVMAFIRGDMVRNLIKEGMEIWGHCNQHIYAEGQSLKTFLVKLLLSEDRTASADATAPMMLLTKTGVKFVGDYYKNPADAGLFAAIDSSRESINIVCPNLNDAVLLEKLTAAALRGVQVRIMLPRNYQNFGSWLDRAGNYISMMHWAHLPQEAKGNFAIRWYSNNDRTYSDNHSKYYSVDRLVSFLGSLNGDNQSICFSRELLLAIEDKAAVRRLDQQVFENPWNTSIPARPHWMHSLLPIPGATLLRRISRTCALPLDLFKAGWKRIRQYVMPRPSEFETNEADGE